ncbi:probable ribosome biogenesis protein RLP24 [Tetranychus urticae]|uniref:Probable ribosome biogenesis protein RLP24 n=1 Tax=Tetranychus urticae TaxID=32264 RepID=T1K7D5_TETUR|nr:probable ribosome biogenesis protein RLP24 [Tetranychus urticae]
MRIERCYFCSSPIYPGHGIVFVRNDCKLFRFCRSKCRRRFNQKKNPRKTKWTKAYRKAAGKELVNDPSFEFEKRRNIPLKYNRELWNKTIEAMKTVTQIRKRRESEFVLKRLRKANTIERERDIKEVKRDMALIKSPAAGMKREKRKTKPKVIVKFEDEMEEENSEEEEEMEEESETEMVAA